MTSITTDSCGNDSSNESFELTTNTFTHPYTKTYSYNNVEIKTIKNNLNQLDEIEKGYINNIENLKQEYYSQVIESDALIDYLQTHKKIWLEIYKEYEYEEPIEFRNIVNDNIRNIKMMYYTLQSVEKEYAKYKDDYIKNRQKLINTITFHTEGLYSTEFV
jgi:hypothetical protein